MATQPTLVSTLTHKWPPLDQHSDPHNYLSLRTSFDTTANSCDKIKYQPAVAGWAGRREGLAFHVQIECSAPQSPIQASGLSNASVNPQLSCKFASLKSSETQLVASWVYNGEQNRACQRSVIHLTDTRHSVSQLPLDAALDTPQGPAYCSFEDCSIAVNGFQLYGHPGHDYSMRCFGAEWLPGAP
ncbi:hypothetical protein GOBAR_AA12055 [Gossypium barbadense]|uniref:Uncharacterized protein n=1 Tax=Gossypium barbadense TaxID=3634 RepID=A0A2P5XZ02_GOSBA|nr:hypothetical protein GOBAR_AA12055 [Gossypium barbadense]